MHDKDIKLSSIDQDRRMQGHIPVLIIVDTLRQPVPKLFIFYYG